MPIVNTVYPQVGSNTGDATATASQILAPYTAYVATGKVTGTMPPFSQQTVGTAQASDISQGKTAWVNGSQITGTLSQSTLSMQLKNGDISFDGTDITIPQAAIAVVGSFSWLYNNNYRTITLTVILDENYGGPVYTAFLTGYEIDPQQVTITAYGYVIDGITYITRVTLISPVDINGTYNSQDLSNLFLVGFPPS